MERANGMDRESIKKNKDNVKCYCYGFFVRISINAYLSERNN